MSVAALNTREDKLNWLLRPAQWASTLSFFSAIFGFVYWYYGFLNSDNLVIGLCSVLAANAALLIWAVARVSNVVRRAF